MNITLNIPSIDNLAEAINNLASVVKASGTPTPTPQLCEELGKLPPITPPAEETTPAQRRKTELCELIVAAGGTPPTSGSVSKFKDALAALQTPVVETPVVETPVVETPVVETPVVETPVVETPVVETPVVETPVEETPVEETPVEETPVEETPVEETPVEETPVEETPVEETPVEETPVADTPVEETLPPTHTLENVRILAGYVVRNQSDFDGKKSQLGKTKLGACLKKAGAKSITTMFEDAPESVAGFVSDLEANAGKTLAEAVAEATA